MTTDKREAELPDPDPSALIVRLVQLSQPPYDSGIFGGPMAKAAAMLTVQADQLATLRQSLSAAEATIAAQAELAEKRRDEIEAAEARVGEMREALEPWKAVCAQLVKPNFLDCESVLFDAWGNAVGTVGDLRRAARASD